MNKLLGCIEEVQIHGGLTEVTLLMEGNIRLQAIVIETPESSSRLGVGKEVSAIFKETEVILARKIEGKLSLTNRIPAKVQDIEMGVLLCRISLKSKPGPVRAILSRRAVESMGIKAGEELTILVKSNEVMIGS